MSKKTELRIERAAPNHWSILGAYWHHSFLPDGREMVQREVLAEFSTRAEARRWLREHKKDLEGNGNAAAA
jgi:hypothetical protein